MKDFNVFLEGAWGFSCVIEANSKEEAIRKAIQDIDNQVEPIDLIHTKQWLEDEE